MQEYKEIFGADNFFIELQNHGIEAQKRILPQLIKLARENGVGLVATNDAHYIDREDSATQKILVCIQTGRTVNDPSDMEFQTDEFYVKSLEEMRRAIPAVDGALKTRCASPSAAMWSSSSAAPSCRCSPRRAGRTTLPTSGG